MNTATHSKTGLFLIELILSIFFFIIITIVCIQLFVRSYTISNSTINMNHSIQWIQNISEIFLSYNGDFSKLKDALEYTSSCSDSTLEMFFDDDWNIINNKKDASYIINAVNTLTKTSDGKFSLLIITAEDNEGEIIFTNTIKKYIGQ